MTRRAIFQPDQVKQIRKEHIAYLIGYETLAKKYNCGASTIRDMVTYRTYRWVK